MNSHPNSFESSTLEPRRFEFKGKRAESVVNELAFRSFLSEWCFPNPRWEDGKEICDLLVAFDRILIIFQVKVIAHSGKDQRYRREAIEKPTQQVLGAERLMRKKGRTPPLTAASGAKEAIEISAFDRIYLVVVTLGDGNVGLPTVQVLKGRVVHTFDRSFALILSELDTIADFVRYLGAKEEMLGPRELTISGREEDLLADYVQHGKSLAHLTNVGAIQYPVGFAEGLFQDAKYLSKKEADNASYLWDHFIELGKSDPDPIYRHVVRELSRLDRVQRRAVSAAFISASLVTKKLEKA
ncbi:MAG: hypothetical protein IPH75_05345 [bacterium]|nr:hypothetical protein [bacterium]